MMSPLQEKTLNFSFNVLVGGKETNTITVRPPKVRDVLEIGTPGMKTGDFEIAMMAHVCGATVEEIMDWPLGTGTKVREVYEDFLALGEGTKSGASS